MESSGVEFRGVIVLGGGATGAWSLASGKASAGQAAELSFPKEL